jgi:hypothetical protein
MKSAEPFELSEGLTTRLILKGEAEINPEMFRGAT